MAYAIQYYDPSPQGDNTPKYLDVQTGTPIDYSNLKYYDVASQQDVESGKVKLPEQDQKKYDEVFRNGGSNQGAAPTGSTAGPRSMSNNYGYAHKPGFMSLAGALPGPAGLVAKGANLAMNANNRQAVQDARTTLGLPAKNNVMGFISDNKGLVGNVNLTDPMNPARNETVPVGFEASDKTGRTMMTPNEARNRSLTNPGSMVESQPQDVKDAQNNFKASGLTAPKQESIAGKMMGNVFGGSYNTHATDSTNHVARGLGLGDLSPSFKAAEQEGENYNPAGTTADAGRISYSHPERGDVTKGLTPETQGVMNSLAGLEPGGIQVSSAYRNPTINDDIGGATKSYHMTGQAFDVSTKGMTDQQRSDLTQRARMAGAEEIGTYDDNSLHITSDRRNPANVAGVAAMFNRSEHNMDKAPGWFSQGLTSASLAPTPTERPSSLEMKMAKDDQLNQTPTQTQTPTTPNVSFASPPTSPAQDRYGKLSVDDRRMMAMTLAGEIDPSKTKIGTPDFTAEANGIAQTMDNRVGKYGSMAAVLGAPKQYSTWDNPAAANTAIQNYNLNPEAYDNAVKGYYSDDKNNQGFTSYHSLAVNPGWGASMQNPTQIGAHMFGTLSEYNSQPAPAPAMDKPTFSSAAQSNLSQGPTAAADNSGHFSGPSQVGTGGQNDSNSSSPGGPSGTSGGTRGGGFASNPSTSHTDNDSDSDNGGRSGYGGSRSDGWN